MAAMSYELDRQAPRDQVRQRVETILRRDLKLGSDVRIDEDTPLIGGDFELDSLDVVLMVSSVEKEFGIKIANETIGKDAFSSVGSLVQFLQDAIEQNRQTQRETNQPDHTEQTEYSPDNGHANNNGNGNGNSHYSPKPAEADDLLDALPHQPPFRFISSLTELAPQVHGEALWKLTGQEDFFAGHFPGRPIVPAVLVSEALAQLSGLVGVDHRAAALQSQNAELAHVDVRFRQAVTPPDTIVLRSRMLQNIDGLQRFEVQALRYNEKGQPEKVIADGQLTLKRNDAR